MEVAEKQRVIALASEFMKGGIGADAFYEGLTQAIAGIVNCSRASLWRYTSELRDSVVCLDLYDSVEKTHAKGAVLSEDDFGEYFAAMRRDSLIVASHARSHPATSCFNELYFEPNGIHSLLDVGINISGTPFGLFCCEQVTFVKEWTDADVEILRSVGTLCGLAFKKVSA